MKGQDESCIVGTGKALREGSRRLLSCNKAYNREPSLGSGIQSEKITEYRELLNDHETSDTKILERLEYLEAFCRQIIRNELNAYE